MVELNFEFGEVNGCIVDPILYNRFNDFSKSDFIVNISLNASAIIDLSHFVWIVYNEILDDFKDDDFGYFDDSDEPFPDSPETIQKNPGLINDYIIGSNLWRDNILNRFLFPPNETGNYNHFIVDYRSTNFQNETLIISFYAVSNQKKG